MKAVIERFAAELAPLVTYRGASHGAFAPCADLEEAGRRVLEVCRRERLERVAVAGREELAPVAAALSADASIRLHEAESVDEPGAFADFDAGLGGADLLIAESATLVLVDGPREPRALSLLPPVHLCVGLASRLVPRIHDALDRLGPGSGAWPQVGASPTFTLVTGPSRTADIEKTLVVPAHGPSKLYVFLVMDEEV